MIQDFERFFEKLKLARSFVEYIISYKSYYSKYRYNFASKIKMADLKIFD